MVPARAGSTLRQFLDSLTNEQMIDRLNLALDGASLGIWDWDLSDDSVQFDRRWCEMLGLDVEQTPMLLSTWVTRVHPDDIGQCYVDIQAYLAGATPRYENIHRMRHANDEWIYVLDRGRVSGWDADGRPIRFTGTHFDCTATELAKQVVQDQQDLLADLIRGLPTAVAMFDADDLYLAASDEWLALFELRDLPGHDQRAQPFPSGWDELRRRTHAGESLAAEQDLVTVEGQPRFLRWSMRPWRAVGKIAGIIINCEDVTRATEDRVARERESRLSTLGLMAGGIAHEINTPLQSLMINAALIQEEIARDPFDPQFLHECNAAIIETTQHIARTVHALRTVSRQVSADPLTDLDACALVDAMLDLCGARFRAADIELRIHKHVHEHPEIRGRAADIGQILLNLLNNAFDAVVDQAERWVDLELVERDSQVVFRVVDSGLGIPLRIRDRLMTPFCTTKPLGKGTGLGLSLSRSLAEGQAAQLVHDALAPHTTFELRFPRGGS